MSSSVKSRKEIGEKRKGCGRIGIFHSLLDCSDEQGLQEKAKLRHLARDPVELGAFLRAQIIGSEGWLLL